MPEAGRLLVSVRSALGGGFELMLTTDLVVAADHARFGLPEVTRASPPAEERDYRRIPLQVAWRWA